MTTVSVPVIERLCCEIIACTCRVQECARRLRDNFQSTLLYRGRPYPGEDEESVVGVDHLVRVMEYLQRYTGPVILLV